MDIGAQAIAIWARLWAKGEPALMNQILDNPQLFNGYEKLVKETRCALVPGGKFDDVVANLELRGQSETASELAALGRSEGASAPWMLIRCFDRLTIGGVAERVQQAMLRMMDGSASVLTLKSAIDEILIPAIDLYPAPEPAGAREVAIEWNDSETDPMTEEPEAIIEGLLYTGLTFVSGKWKECMKTTIVTALIQHVAQGLPFLGRQVRQKRCGFVQLDTPLAQFLKIATDLRTGMGTPAHAIPGWIGHLDLRQPGDQARLSQWVKDQEIELLAIDSLSAVFHGNENHADEVKPVLRGFFLKTLRDGLGCNIVILAHPNRAGTSTTRGSGDWEAAADSNWKLTAKVEDDITRSVTISVSGRHPPQKLTVELDFPEPGIAGRPGHAGITIREVAAPTKPGPQRKSPIRQVLQEATDWLSTDAIAKLAHCSWKTATAELGRLLSAGEVDRRTREGRGGGDEWRLREPNSDTPTTP